MKLIGLARIGNEPELRYTSSNMAVLQLSLAYAYGKEKATQWVSASLFGKRAEALSQYLAKGQLIYAEVSEVHIDIFTGKDGKEKDYYTLECLAFLIKNRDLQHSMYVKNAGVSIKSFHF